MDVCSSLESGFRIQDSVLDIIAIVGWIEKRKKIELNGNSGG
jgi:hypothetical protein